MEIQILFYTRKDFGGWRRFTWYPVQIAQGKFVHCEMFIGSKVLNASNKEGVVWQPPGPYEPSGVLNIEVDSKKLDKAIEAVLGDSYSWGGFFRLLWPRWGSDPKGMICSELVAYILREAACDLKYRCPFIAVPPYRWTPHQIYSALTSLAKEGI
jgi:hypothetical protein